ncbi:MAG: glycosyltransferase, partial [Candidatus Bathyarchaeia archaeon]
AHARYLSARLKIPVREAYNGIDISMYPLQPDVSVRKRYLSLNRIMPEKSLHNVIDVIRRARAFGDIVGEDRRLIPDLSYVERVRRLCDGYHVRFWGRVSHEAKVKFLENAKATICLTSPPYIEVFGLAAVESLSCGTPAITLAGSGGLEEIIEHGKSGFICSSPESIVRIIKEDAVSTLKPEDCRERVQQNFTYKKMAERYLKLCKEILNEPSAQW